MNKSLYWADNYLEKQMTPLQAIRRIKSGARVFIGSACGEPQVLVKALFESWNQFTGLEIIRMMSRETVSLTEIANKTQDVSLNVRAIYLGSAGVETIARYKRFLTPMNISEVPSLFLSRKLPIDVALIQVSPADDFGWMSLGVSVDVTLSAAMSADFVIAQVNSKMPRIMGRSFIHVNDVDAIVEHDEPILTATFHIPSAVSATLGQHIVRLIEDGSTLQIGLDAASQATLKALSEKNDLGFHSQFLSDDVMHLYAKGVINNRKKGLNDGKLVASSAVGTSNLYEFLHDNPAVEFQPSNYVNDPFVICQHNQMVSINVASAIDLTGQVAAEASYHTLYAGVSGIPDFLRGAKRSVGGKSILMLESISPDTQKSSIVPVLINDAVVVPRGDVQYVATEYGVVNLFGKSLQERAMALISIAHPKFRDWLFDSAKEDGLITTSRELGDLAYGIYPVRFEEIVKIGGDTITIRPAKPVDQRKLQEHYYRLDKEDVFMRFFHEKSCFAPQDIDLKSRVDYKKDLVLIGLVGEAGFGKIIAVGEYLLLLDSNMAEVAFSVNREYRGKGLGRVFLNKLAQAAKENGIAGLIAYTVPQNKAMIKLFKTLPYKVRTSFECDSLSLSCRFDEPAEL